MSSKPSRARKVPNKEPRPAPLPVIDPQLLDLDNSLLSVADDSDEDISGLTIVDLIVPLIYSQKSKRLAQYLTLLYKAQPEKKCNTLVVWLKPCPD
jgi:hypothetical protein